MNNIKNKISQEIKSVFNIYPTFKQVPPEAVERLSLRLADLFSQMKKDNLTIQEYRKIGYRVFFYGIMSNGTTVPLDAYHIAPENFDSIPNYDIVQDIVSKTDEFNIIDGQNVSSFSLICFNESEEICACCYSDDMVHEIEFDAQSFFCEASDHEILHIMTNLSGSIYSDKLVKNEAIYNEEIARMLNYVETKNWNNKPMGFGLDISKAMALRWLENFRPIVYNQIVSLKKESNDDSTD